MYPVDLLKVRSSDKLNGDRTLNQPRHVFRSSTPRLVESIQVSPMPSLQLQKSKELPRCGAESQVL